MHRSPTANGTASSTHQVNELIFAVAAAQPRTVVALCNGAPVEMPWVGEVPAILELYLGGQVRTPLSDVTRKHMLLRK